MSGVVSNNRFLTRLLTSGKEDFERVTVQCEVFDCSIFKCEIMPAMLANTFILQGSVAADLGFGGIF